MKRLLTSKPESEIQISVHKGDTKRFLVSKEKARGLVLILNEYQVEQDKAKVNEETVSADEVFRELDQKYGRPGAALQGARLKEGLSQVELAKKLRISQSDLSKMERGKRSIGKRMARKLALVLRVDYRIFL